MGNEEDDKYYTDKHGFIRNKETNAVHDVSTAPPAFRGFLLPDTDVDFEKKKETPANTIKRTYEKPDVSSMDRMKTYLRDAYNHFIDKGK